jgi:hypothetical protein
MAWPAKVVSAEELRAPAGAVPRSRSPASCGAAVGVWASISAVTRRGRRFGARDAVPQNRVRRPCDVGRVHDEELVVGDASGPTQRERVDAGATLGISWASIGAMVVGSGSIFAATLGIAGSARLGPTLARFTFEDRK